MYSKLPWTAAVQSSGIWILDTQYKMFPLILVSFVKQEEAITWDLVFDHCIIELQWHLEDMQATLHLYWVVLCITTIHNCVKGRVESYLQIWYPFLKGLWVLSEQPLLFQELGIMAVRGGLEQTIVQDVPQRFGQGAQHLLLGLPHCGIWVKPQTFLQERQK